MICNGCGTQGIPDNMENCPRCQKDLSGDTLACRPATEEHAETSMSAMEVREKLIDNGKCPTCKARLVMQEGCMHCPFGCWSACG